MRILGIDPGDKRIGVAISDLSSTIANPLTTLVHRSRKENAERIIRIAEENDAKLVVIGQSLDADGIPTFQGRKSRRLAAEIKAHSSLQTVLWDEYSSTKTAIDARRKLGVSRKKRAGHQDNLAAAVILQSYLDSLRDTDLSWDQRQ